MAGEQKQLMPSDTPDFMFPAWYGCMRWAIGEPKVREAFERETGMAWSAPRNGLEQAIDQATGHGNEYVARFIAWANVNVWGTDDIARHDTPGPETEDGREARLTSP